MNYAVGCAFNLDEMFMNFPYKKLKLTCKDAKEINGDAHRDKIVKKVFRTCLKRVLEDIIDNNVTFELPTGSRKSELHMRRISGEKFSQCRRNGKFQEIDFLQSFFTGYEIELNMYKRGGLKRSKTVYVDPRLKQKIIDNTNNGKQYC